MERSIKPEDLKAELAGKHLIDVRRPTDCAASLEQLPGATWHDPSDIDGWRETLPRDKEIILYCVRGGSVSNSVLDSLRAQGFNARYIEGGIEGWKAIGGALADRT